jgi:hypothetical protein
VTFRPDNFDAPPSNPQPPPAPPAGDPEYWAKQTQLLASDLNAVGADLAALGAQLSLAASIFERLAVRLPRAIHEAADLGVLVKHHEMANLSTALQGDIAMNMARDDAQATDHASITQLQNIVALLRADVERLAGELRQLRGEEKPS